MLDGTYLVECSCGSDEHDLKFTIDAECEEIFLSTFLHHYRPWYQRVWVAVKYVFGYKCKYGHFDCTTMRKEQVDQLQKCLTEFYKLVESKNV
jgi:methionyl-tRNA synthetase